MNVANLNMKDKVILPASAAIPVAEPFTPVGIPEEVHPDLASGVRPVAELYSYARGEMEKLNRLRTNPDPRHNPAAHAAEIEKASLKASEAVRLKTEAALNRVKDDLALNERNIDAMTGSFANPQAAELRAVIRGLPEQERLSVISKAVEQLDAPLIEAVLNSHPLALGVTAEFLDGQRHVYRSKVCPELLAEREALLKAQAHLSKAVGKLAEFFANSAKVMEPYRERVSKAEAARQNLN